jgi:hypothetical protein
VGLTRRQHYLKDNKHTEFPYHFIFFDTETKQTRINEVDIEHKLKLGVACYWRRPDSNTKEQIEYERFKTCEQFWTFVVSKLAAKRRVLVISHNLPFDMGIVKGWHYLDKLQFKPTKIILDYRCNIWRFRRNTSTLLFLDNMNYFQTSLKVLGDSLGLAKMDMPDESASIDDWFVYARRDVEILLKAWRTWLDFLIGNDLGSFGYTIASQAINAFRHRFMPVKISIHTSEKAIALERFAYRGGRCECFRIGEYHGADFYMVDVNSMYPYIMANSQFPCNLVSTGDNLLVNEAQRLLYKYALIARCQVRTDTPCYAVKLKDKLVFPVGEFPAVLTSSEILAGINDGHILQINDWNLYEKAFLFQDYVDFFYSSRLKFEEKHSTAYAYLCKIMLNSLYGKFGQRSEDWKYVTDDPTRLYDWWQEYDVDKKEIFTYRCINHRVEVSTGFHEGYNSLVAIASEVTANARLMLWYLIEQAGLNNVFYCDTDSLIVTSDGLDRLSDQMFDKQIGKLKLVSQANTLSIHNLKDYSFGGKVRIKGVRNDAELIAYNKYKQLQSLGIKTGLHHQDINRVIWREVVKELKREYDKGEVLDDGRVIPIKLSTLLDV